MGQPPVFVNDSDFRSRRFDPEFWLPYVQTILEDAGWHRDGSNRLEVGIGGTYPTFLHGDIVIKLFGYLQYWNESFHNEQAAHEVLAADSNVLVPDVRDSGCLFPGEAASWPYLITTRIRGTSWHDASLARDQRLAVAAELGDQIKRIQRLSAGELPTMERWRNLDVSAAAEKSSFPQHLIPQVHAFLADIEFTNETVVHGDLFSRHVFVGGGALTGVIDWGDAMFCDCHYELPKLFLDTFACDKELLRVFLHTAGWSVDHTFARQCMGMALYRQAIGSVQHLTNDVFYQLPELLPMEDMATIDELADAIFSV